MKKVVLKLDLHDDKAKRKAMKAVSTVSGIDSISMDMKEHKLTVIGAMDPVNLVSRLRKHWDTAMIISVGPAKEPEPEKKEEPKKEEAEKKDEPKKEEPKKEGAAKEEPKKEAAEKKEEPKKPAEGEKKKDPHEQIIMDLVSAYKAYNPQMTTQYYVHSIEENPNSCVIS